MQESRTEQEHVLKRRPHEEFSHYVQRLESRPLLECIRNMCLKEFGLSSEAQLVVGTTTGAPPEQYKIVIYLGAGCSKVKEHALRAFIERRLALDVPIAVQRTGAVKFARG